MPGYTNSALKKFGHPKPRRPQNSPHRHNDPDYGAKVQKPEMLDLSAPLDKDAVKRIQNWICLELESRTTSETRQETKVGLNPSKTKEWRLTRLARQKNV